MIKKELSPEQIEQLFVFVRRKYVRYIDCQYELVDHLASAIEEEMEIDNTLDFKQALSKVYNRFPITGFSNIIREKETAMTKYWSKRLRKCILNILHPPQIFAFFVITGLLYSLSYHFEYGAIITLIIAYLSSIASYYYRKKYYTSIFSLSSHKLLVVSVCRGLMGIEVCTGLTAGMIFNHSSQHHFWGSLFIALAVAYSIFWNYAASTAFPEMIKEELEQKYAHIDYQKVFAK